jgi:lycopene cyclase domain-containing protein
VSITYLQFHAVFVVPPLAALLLVARGRPRVLWRRALWVGVPVLAVLALAYTTPWDNHLIAEGVWWYGDGAVAARFWLAPLGEYLFILLQPVVTALWLSRLASPAGDAIVVSRSDRVVGGLAAVAVGLAGAAMLALEATFYMGAILAWGAPILAIQWAFGWPYLWHARRTVALGTLVPTLYFGVADRVAIELGVWTISKQFTTGLTVGGLPLEEGAFFLVTNLFVVQGLVLLRWVMRRW